ncbi:MAG: hypothetical protein JWM19_2536 [Actinomycetia bacterium]|nr:hypothetical protein [Actinomycetes bacterium]
MASIDRILKASDIEITKAADVRSVDLGFDTGAAVLLVNIDEA